MQGAGNVISLIFKTLFLSLFKPRSLSTSAHSCVHSDGSTGGILVVIVRQHKTAFLWREKLTKGLLIA